jgi:hypothetical protein
LSSGCDGEDDFNADDILDSHAEIARCWNAERGQCDGKDCLINEPMDEVQFADGGCEVPMRKKKPPDLTPA